LTLAWALLEVWMEAASSLIGLLVGIYALKAYRIVRERSLLYLNTSFLIIGSGMLTRVFVLVTTQYLQLRFLLQTGNLIYLLSTLVGYLMLALAYAGRGWGKATIAAQMGSLLEISRPLLFFHLIDVFLLIYVCSNLVSSYLAERSRAQLSVLAGFLLILSSHAMPLLAIIYPPLLLLEAAIRLAGFLSLFVALATVALRR